MMQAFAERQHQHGLPGFFYHDPDVYAADLELIWHREWLFAGSLAELPEAGNYITMQAGSFPILGSIFRGLQFLCYNYQQFSSVSFS